MEQLANIGPKGARHRLTWGLQALTVAAVMAMLG